MKILPKPGQRFEFNGSIFEIAFVNSGSIRYSEIHGGKTNEILLKKFHELRDNNIIIMEKGSYKNDDESFNLLHITELEKTEMNYRLHFVRGVLNLNPENPASKKRVEPILKELAKEKDYKKVPKFSTYAKWLKKYIESNRNPISLIPHHRKKGNYTLRFDPLIELIINNRIKEDYLTLQRASKIQVARNISGNILKEFSGKDSFDLTKKIPSSRTINRRINNLDPYKKYRFRHGKYKSNKEFKAAGKSLEIEECLSYVEADGHILDVIIVDNETNEHLGRPYATVLIDIYSRCILSVVISMIPFSSTTILKALSKAISDTSNLPSGLFDRIIFDNGSDYISNSIRNFCNTLGIIIEYGQPRDGNCKPHIERFFRTLNSQISHNIPGTTFSNPEDRGDYDSIKYSCITKDELEDVINEWINNIYHKTIHSSTGRVPLTLWNEFSKKGTVIRYPENDLKIIARSTKTRTISKGRVKLFNLTWYSHALITLEKQLKDAGKNTKVDIHIDELDLSVVYIKDPRKDGEFIQADSTKPKYTKELSLYEHNCIQENIKDKGKKDITGYGEYELIIARWELWEKLVDLGKSHAKKQIARLKETTKISSLQNLPKKTQSTNLLPDPDNSSKSDSTNHTQKTKKINQKDNNIEDFDVEIYRSC